jgi:hypothetical protein
LFVCLFICAVAVFTLTNNNVNNNNNNHQLCVDVLLMIMGIQDK